MSDLAKTLRATAPHYQCTKLLNDAADLIEQQQARIAELEAQINGPDHYETWKDAAIHERVKRVAAEKERDGLTATVERLRGQLSDMASQHECGCGHPACKRCIDDADNQAILAATPQQNLNALKREAILNIHFPNRYPKRMWTGTEVQNWLIEHANTKYPSDKE